jgi:hypothetical protein
MSTSKFPGIVWFIGLIIPAQLLLASCGLMPISESEAAKRTEIRATELDINVRQTLIVQQQTELANNPIIPTDTPLPPTLVVPSEAPQINQPPTAVIENTTVAVQTPEETDLKAFEDWMGSAKILLYEDMTARLETVRDAKYALDKMGLKYKDDGSAIGWYIDDLKNGPQDGGQWDLIIIATEEKKGVRGEFASNVLTAAEQGTSVIYETWYLNNTYSSSASGLLAHCGLEFDRDWVGIPPSQTVLFPLNPDHPVLNQPNNSLNFGSSTDQWYDPSGKITYDVGDLIKLAPDSRSTLLLGTAPALKTSHATLAVCDDGKITLQTFSSHVLAEKVMIPLWENYIYNALLARYQTLNP